jgi:hypothetical protein
MLKLMTSLALGGASAACGFAAIAVAMYPGGPAQATAVALFAGVGFGTGLLCGAAQLAFGGMPTPTPAPLAPEALASLVRATLAETRQVRAARPAVPERAAGQQPTPAEIAATALAGAAARSLTPSAQASTLAAADDRATAAAPPLAHARRFASSRFGA